MQVLSNNRAGLIQRMLFIATRSINLVALVSLPAMMALTAADVFLRYFFNSPIIGSAELTEFLVALVTGMGLAYVGIRREHIVVSVIADRLEPRIRSVIDSVLDLVSGVFAALISWRIFINAETLRLDERVTPQLHIPISPIVFLVAFGFGMLALVFFYNACEPLTNVIRRNRRSIATVLLLIILLGVAVFFVPALPWQDKVPPTSVGLIGIILILVLLFLGMPVGIVMGLIGFLGLVYLIAVKGGLTNIGLTPYTTMASYTLSIIPLFVLMGELCFHSGITSKMYDAAYRWVGRLPGGLAIATVGACAGFACVTGSSVATVATIGSVAFPEMQRYKYDIKLSTGCIVAASGLGILIPPSISLALYGIVAGESIGKLFLAGIVPGIIHAILYILTILVICRRNPRLGPKGESFTIGEKFTSLKNTWPVLVLFIFVIGGIYLGLFTPMEAGGIGAFGAFLIALVMRKLNWAIFLNSLRSTVNISSVAILLLIGANIFGYFLAVTRLPFELSTFVTNLPVNEYVILGIIIIVYLILGCFIASLAMILLTVPIFLPVITTLGFDPIWFGVIVTVMCEIAVITPPFGINIFVLKGIGKDVPIYTMFRGIIPFLMADFSLTVLLVAFPKITLFLPNLMK